MTTPLALLRLVLLFAWPVLLVRAYIPALPTNDSAAVQAGVNESDTSMLRLQWCVHSSSIVINFKLA